MSDNQTNPTSGLTPERFKEELQLKEVSLRQLSKILGISTPTLSRYARGIGAITRDNYNKLSRYFEAGEVIKTDSASFKMCYIESLGVQRKLLRHIRQLEQEIETLRKANERD